MAELQTTVSKPPVATKTSSLSGPPARLDSISSYKGSCTGISWGLDPMQPNGDELGQELTGSKCPVEIR